MDSIHDLEALWLSEQSESGRSSAHLPSGFYASSQSWPSSMTDTYPVLDTIEDEIHKRWVRLSYGTSASGANCKPFASSVYPS